MRRLRCRVELHRWRTVGSGTDAGWECSDCGELVLAADRERERLERVYDDTAAGAAYPYGSAAGVAAGPPPVG